VSLPYFPLGKNGYPAKNVIAITYFLAKNVIIYNLRIKNSEKFYATKFVYRALYKKKPPTKEKAGGCLS
jgi:hypothetical protein